MHEPAVIHKPISLITTLADNSAPAKESKVVSGETCALVDSIDRVTGEHKINVVCEPESHSTDK